MSTPSEQLPITDGPSLLDLIIALAKCYDDYPQRVRMMVQQGQIGRAHEIAIRGLKHEDRFGHNWLFEGDIIDMPRWQKVEGYYSTATRKGWLRFV